MPSGSLAVMLFEIMTGAVFVVGCLARCILAPESMIDSVCLIREFGGIQILPIKLGLGVLILFDSLFPIAIICIPFHLPQMFYCSVPTLYGQFSW